MRIADTSFLYALFSRTDRHHSKAVRDVRARSAIVIPAEIYGETIALVHYRAGFEAAKAAGDWLRTQPHIVVGVGSPGVSGEAWQAFVSARGKLSYPDSVVVVWTRHKGARPLAYDTRILAFSRS